MKERWAEVAREVPGRFGGVLNESGPVIYLVDTTRRADAIAALVARGVLPVAKGEKARVRQGRWDFAQLYDWYRYLAVHLPSERVSSAIDEGQNRIWYGMVDEQQRVRFERALAPLRLPCFLVTLEVTGPMILE